uniref:Tyrosine specific protein phosphatases domain-containing protein n=1 Tax=Timema genevievae TaxID=629358 RepID=A0A7R9PH18_TIMGE|nr:unnamed protein product [Timema genevievae]
MDKAVSETVRSRLKQFRAAAIWRFKIEQDRLVMRARSKNFSPQKMSGHHEGRNPGSIPNRWLHCPRKSSGLIANKFLAFKTPLSEKFNDQVPSECRFGPKMIFNSMKSYKVSIGLWIDLTNTSRFYDKAEVESENCRYLKLQCRGHGETPSEEQTRTFIHICQKFIAQHPSDIIGVHCTHGFNRTGFLIVSYLVEQINSSVGGAIKQFAEARQVLRFHSTASMSAPFPQGC